MFKERKNKTSLLIFFAFIFTCLVLVGAEVGIRYYETPTAVTQYDSDMYRYKQMVPDPFLLFRTPRNIEGETINTNSFGYRSPELEKNKSHGVFRIAILGGSGAAGYGASHDDMTFHRVLETTFNSTFDQFRTEVINAAIPSYVSSQELVLLVTEVVDFDPDVIVVIDGVNDIGTSLDPNDQPVGYPQGWYKVTNGWSNYIDGAIVHRFVNKLRIVSYGYRLANRFSTTVNDLQRLIAQTDEKAMANKPTLPKKVNSLPLDYAAIEKYENNLSKMVRFATSYNIKTILIVQPISLEHRSFNSSYELWDSGIKAIFQAMSRVAQQHNVSAFDYSNIFQIEFGDEAKNYFSDWVHLNDSGNYFLGKRIYQLLLSERYIPASKDDN